MPLVTHLFEADDDTLSLNKKYVDVLPEGIWTGYNILATNPVSNKITIGKGDDSSNVILTEEGVRIEELTDLEEVLTIAPGDPTYPRIDLIVQKFQYGVPNSTDVTYEVIQGTITGDIPLRPTAPSYSQVLGEVFVAPNQTQFDSRDFYRARPNRTGLGQEDVYANTTLALVGDVVTDGLLVTEVGAGQFFVNISSGECFIKGKDYIHDIGTLSRTMALTPARVVMDPRIATSGMNLNPLTPFLFASKLKVTLTASSTPVVGATLKLRGTDELGHIHSGGDDEVFIVNLTAGETKVFETSRLYQAIEFNGIDCVGMTDVTIHIEDMPLHKLYGIGEHLLGLQFRMVLTQEVPDNSLLLANILTDTNGIVSIEMVNRSESIFNEIRDARQGKPSLLDNLLDIRGAIGASRLLLEDDLGSQADGVVRTFTLAGVPLVSTEFVVYGGLTLWRGLHYSISGSSLEIIDPALPAPEASDYFKLRYAI